jgi:hypothetical protein
VDATHPISASGRSEESLDAVLLRPLPEHPAECADAATVLRLLASGVPLLLLPDLAWPGRIPAGPEQTVPFATITGPIGIVGGRSTGWPGAAAAPAGGEPAVQEYAADDADFPAGRRAC